MTQKHANAFRLLICEHLKQTGVIVLMRQNLPSFEILYFTS